MSRVVQTFKTFFLRQLLLYNIRILLKQCQSINEYRWVKHIIFYYYKLFAWMYLHSKLTVRSLYYFIALFPATLISVQFGGFCDKCRFTKEAQCLLWLYHLQKFFHVHARCGAVIIRYQVGQIDHAERSICSIFYGRKFQFPLRSTLKSRAKIKAIEFQHFLLHYVAKTICSEQLSNKLMFSFRERMRIPVLEVFFFQIFVDACGPRGRCSNTENIHFSPIPRNVQGRLGCHKIGNYTDFWDK